MGRFVCSVLVVFAAAGATASTATAAKLRGSTSGLKTSIALDPSGSARAVYFTFKPRCQTGTFTDRIVIRPTNGSFKGAFDYNIRQRGGIVARVHTTSSGDVRSPFRWTGRFAMSAIVKQHGRTVDRCRLKTRSWRATTPQIHIHLAGDAGDYIVGGGTYDYASPKDPVSLTGDRRQILGEAGDYSLVFIPPHGQTLKPGTYTDARRSAFADGHAGVEVTGDGRGCNEATGQFTINAISFSRKTGKLTKLDMSFEEHCEGGAPALRGTLTLSPG